MTEVPAAYLFTASFEDNDRALCDGEPAGFVKVLAKKGSGVILGAVMWLASVPMSSALAPGPPSSWRGSWSYRLWLRPCPRRL